MNEKTIRFAVALDPLGGRAKAEKTRFCRARCSLLDPATREIARRSPSIRARSPHLPHLAVDFEFLDGQRRHLGDVRPAFGLSDGRPQPPLSGFQ